MGGTNIHQCKNVLFAPVGVITRSTSKGLQDHANHPNLDITGLSIPTSLTPIRVTFVVYFYLWF